MAIDHSVPGHLCTVTKLVIWNNSWFKKMYIKLTLNILLEYVIPCHPLSWKAVFIWPSFRFSGKKNYSVRQPSERSSWSLSKHLRFPGQSDKPACLRRQENMFGLIFRLLYKQKLLKWHIILFQYNNCNRQCCCWRYNKLFLLCSLSSLYICVIRQLYKDKVI